MRHFFLGLILFVVSGIYAQDNSKWKLFAVTDGVEVYIDTTSIKRVENKKDETYQYSVVSKKIYADSIGKAEYLNKLESAFAKTEKNQSKIRKKMKRWDELSYTLVEYVYDCGNRRFRTKTITDYTSKNKIIVKTKTPKEAPWTNIKGDDVGDLMLFYVCDYEQ
jgi:hypothetical protein